MVGERHGQSVPVLVDERLTGFDGVGHHECAVDRLALQPDLAAGDPRIVEQIVDHPHLRPEDFGNDRRRQVIDGPGGIACRRADFIGKRGAKDNGRRARPPVPTDEPRRLEAVHFGHVDAEQDT